MAHTRITINGQHYDSPDAMPPDVRRLYDEAMRTMGASLAKGMPGGSTPAGAPAPRRKTGFNVSVNLTGPGERSGSPAPLPFDPTSTEARLRALPMSLAILIGIGLILWAFLR